MKLKIQSAGRRGTLTNAMYMGYRTEVKHTNHITIWLWDLLVFAQCFSSNSRADTCLHRLHPTAAFCTANHWTDWTPWGLRWWPPTLFVREKQKRTVFDVWQSKYIYLFPLLLPRLWGIHLGKKSKNLHVLRADGWGWRYHHQPLWLGVQTCIQLQAGAILPKQQQDKGEK